MAKHFQFPNPLKPPDPNKVFRPRITISRPYALYTKTGFTPVRFWMGINFEDDLVFLGVIQDMSLKDAVKTYYNRILFGSKRES